MFLAITDEGGSPKQVSSVILGVIGSDGTEVDTRPMTWETAAERYHALAPPLPRGTYDLVARLAGSYRPASGLTS